MVSAAVPKELVFQHIKFAYIFLIGFCTSESGFQLGNVKSIKNQYKIGSEGSQNFMLTDVKWSLFCIV